MLQTVIVGDDCALPPPRGIAGRRGLAGTILIHKVLSLSTVSICNVVSLNYCIQPFLCVICHFMYA